MDEVNINDLVRQAAPYLTFQDANGKRLPGNAPSVVVIRPPNMSRAFGSVTDVHVTNTNPIRTPVVVYQEVFANDSDVQQSNTFTYTKNVQKVYTVTFSTTSELGLSISGGFDIKLVSGNTTTSYKYQEVSTKSQQHTEGQTFTVNEPLMVSPHTTLIATMVLDMFENVQLPFSAKLELAGTISLALLAVEGEFRWIGPAGQFIAAALKGGARGWTLNGNVADYSISGTVTTNEGIFANVEVAPTEGLGEAPKTHLPG